ncbi:MAG: hypothetical protein ACKVPX_14800 [Myxococcaceae bacterium]
MTSPLTSRPAGRPLARALARLRDSFLAARSPDATAAAIRGAGVGKGPLSQDLGPFEASAARNGVDGLFALQDQAAMVATLVMAVFKDHRVMDPEALARGTAPGSDRLTDAQRTNLLHAIDLTSRNVKQMLPKARNEASSRWDLPLVIWYHQQALAFDRAAQTARSALGRALD